MRILVVSQYYYPEPFRIHEICESLVKEGHTVTVVTTNPNYPNGEIYDGYKDRYFEEIINGVEVIRCQSRPRYQGNLNLALNYISFCINASIEVMRIKENYDIVFSYQLSPITSAIPAILYKRKAHIPMLLYCLDVWPESLKGSPLEKGILYKLIKKLSIYIYNSADKILVTSPCFVDYINNLCKRVDVEVLYQHANEINIVEVPEELREYKTYKNFMFIGNVGKSQNIECLLKAVSLIKDRSKFKLHIVGSGSFLSKSIEIATDLGINDTVVFHGRKPREEMPKYYSIADVCIVSLKDEGFVGYTVPGKLQEYMAAGKAILGCINGDAAKIINEAKCGVVVNAGDYISLSKCIENLVSDEDLLSLYSINSRKYYLENFRLGVYIDKLLHFLGRM